MIMTSLEWPHLAALGTSFEVSDRVDFLTKNVRVTRFLLVEGLKTLRKRLSTPKLVDISLCSGLEVDLGDPTQNRQETHTSVLRLFVAV